MTSKDSDIAILKKDMEDLKKEIKGLQKWKDHCTLAAAGWGGICMAVLTMGGLIHEYWDKIKHYFQDEK